MKLPYAIIKPIYILLLGLLFFYVLYVFEAFGIQQGLSATGHGFLFRSISFGILNIIVFFIFEYLIAPKLQLKTLATRAIWILFQLLVGGTALFLLFNYFWDWQESYLHSYLLLLSEYFSVMVIPLIAYQLYDQKFDLQIDNTPPEMAFSSENGKDEIKLRPEHLLFIKSDKNYLEIFYRQEESTKSHLVRNRMKRVEDSYADSPYLKRCHRSYLVNPTTIDKIIQQKGKYQVHIGEHIIPVSESFADTFSS